MGDPRGFLTTPRQDPRRRPVAIRLRDWREVYEEFGDERLASQAGRCMDCGIPFCHNGCPLGNLIPEWNDLVWRSDWQAAAERLHATNNFPEFTGRLCPAPCETACVVAITGDAVAIKQVEVGIADRAWQSGWVQPQPPARLTGQTVAIIGSGPAGLAAAQQLARAGHTVAIYERADRIGGLLRYGIPEFKMEKSVLDRRLAQLAAEGVRMRTQVEVGVDIDATDLRRRYDAVVLAIGATRWRDLPVPGRAAAGIHQAMEYLPAANQVVNGDLPVSPIDARGRHVVIIGGGDTGADCLGTAHRQGAASVTQLEIMPLPPEHRPGHQPWPTYPLTYRVTSAHEEGGERLYAVSTTQFRTEPAPGSADRQRVTGIELVDVELVDGRFTPVPGSTRVLPCDLVLLAMGFTGPEHGPLVEQFGLTLTDRGEILRDDRYQTTVPGVFCAGDAGRGQSLIVWAIAEGRSAAHWVDAHLIGAPSALPNPIGPRTRPLMA
ncbi:MAG: glutamate synthase subunit beta [Actinomycetales bacterium]|nr:glutamate synthase subunit beta [Actinomycetales bacterium]